MNENYEFLFELNKKAAKELICCYQNQKNCTDVNQECFLIFPKKRTDPIRISEQELRFAITSLFKPNETIKYFAVEVPTEKTYNFQEENAQEKEKKERSASTDLAFYSKEREKIINIELKSNQPDQKAVDKDIEKLLREEHDGAWCHIFENANSKTVESILIKIKNALDVKVMIDDVVCPIMKQKELYFSFIIIGNTRGKSSTHGHFIHGTFSQQNFPTDFEKFISTTL